MVHLGFRLMGGAAGKVGGWGPAARVTYVARKCD